MIIQSKLSAMHRKDLSCIIFRQREKKRKKIKMDGSYFQNLDPNFRKSRETEIFIAFWWNIFQFKSWEWIAQCLVDVCAVSIKYFCWEFLILIAEIMA